MISLMLAVMLQGAAPVTSFTAPTAPPAKAGKLNKKTGLVCRKESLVGSRMTTRVCVHPQELQVRKDEDRALVEKAQALQTIRQ